MDRRQLRDELSKSFGRVGLHVKIATWIHGVRGRPHDQDLLAYYLIPEDYILSRRINSFPEEENQHLIKTALINQTEEHFVVRQVEVVALSAISKMAPTFEINED